MWDDKDKVIVYKRSHWSHLEWWSNGSPKLQLFQLSQHSHVTNCLPISSSAYFPWNMTIKSKMQLSEGSWDKILHSKSRTQRFGKEFFFLAVCLSKQYTLVPEVVFATSLKRLPRKVNNPFGTTPYRVYLYTTRTEDTTLYHRIWSYSPTPSHSSKLQGLRSQIWVVFHSSLAKSLWRTCKGRVTHYIDWSHNSTLHGLKSQLYTT